MSDSDPSIKYIPGVRPAWFGMCPEHSWTSPETPGPGEAAIALTEHLRSHAPRPKDTQ